MRPAAAWDTPVLERLWQESEALHARLQPGFFRTGAPAGGHDAQVRRVAQRSDEALLVCQLSAAGSGAPTHWPVRSGDPVCGVVHVRVYDTPPAPTKVQRRRAHVEELVVAGWARRRGCGRALMGAAAGWARDRGAGQIVLTVWEGNEEAMAFYRSLGYGLVSTVLAVEI